ncbi:MAG: hypothetical protein GYA63_08730, partial [Armatimonadetes bacterium]|nr:hypothetical protein [Armatimonadota bacterium]
MTVLALCVPLKQALARTAVTPASEPSASLTSLPIHFEPNRGQTDERAMFIARGAGYAMYLSRDAIVMTLKKQDKASKSPPVHRLGRPGKPVTDSVRIELLDANENAVLEGDHQLESRSHYFKGNDPSRYLLNIPNYRAVKCRGIYKGIDLVYYG